MRTTIVLDDDILRAARSVANAKAVSLGRAVSELAREGLLRRKTDVARDGLPVFAVPDGARPITLEDVKRAEDKP
jgi:hypothetical protein